MKRTMPMTMLLPALLTPALLAAQEGAAPDSVGLWPEPMRAGRWGLSFGAFDGGSASLGFHHMTSERGALTFDLSATVYADHRTEVGDSTGPSEQDVVRIMLSLQPGVRRYLSASGPTASFGFLEALIGIDGTSVENAPLRARRWTPTIGVDGGFGLEWFVTDALSIRGEVAAQLVYIWTHETNEGFYQDAEVTQRTVRVELGRSGLAATLHF